MRRLLWSAVVIVLLATVTVAAVLWGRRGAPVPTAAAPSASAPAAAAPRPNIVYVLADDLPWNLLDYLPQVQRMQREGTTFPEYTVTNSLCCPSRASILTGMFPHNTKVHTNYSDDGGVSMFRRQGLEQRTFGTALQAEGYRTGYLGKYLNGYKPGDGPAAGWDEWGVPGSKGYDMYDYQLNENGRIVSYGHAPQDYLNDVMTRKARAFIKQSVAEQKPFALKLASFTPHRPYVPAPRDAAKFPGLTAPRTPNFDRLPTGAAPWLAARKPLTEARKKKFDTDFRLRAQAVQSLDFMISQVRAELTALGVADDTYLVFNSDNGLHLGEYRLFAGKQTAFDIDVNVPLVVTGPGVRAGATSTAAAANIDIAPTFLDWAGAPTPSDIDGHSLGPLLRGEPAPGFRTTVLIEHHGPNFAAGDPDAQDMATGTPPTYDALRTREYTYVANANGHREYYDAATDPWQLTNTAARLPAARLAGLDATLARLKSCRGARQCDAAGTP